MLSLFWMYGNVKKIAIVGSCFRKTQEITETSQSQKTSIPGVTEKYITKTFEGIEAESLENYPRN